ncbi:MAG: hypothetical protein JJU18_00885 [Oceanicaulis sp.]|nr:hypothetical protein [Oceanicaulis sp.]
MIILVAAIGAFLTAAGLVFLLTPVLPLSGGVVARARRRLELTGDPFAAGASLIAGLMFLICGAGILAWSAGLV